jgi:hypothetical protein
MKCTVLSADVTAMILAVSPIQLAHSATRMQESEAHVTADLSRRSFQAAQIGKSAEATEPGQTKSAEPDSTKVRAKSLHGGYAIRARIAKQQKQLARSKKRSLKSKKKMAI